jgi:hypothetical protein
VLSVRVHGAALLAVRICGTTRKINQHTGCRCWRRWTAARRHLSTTTGVGDRNRCRRRRWRQTVDQSQRPCDRFGWPLHVTPAPYCATGPAPTHARTHARTHSSKVLTDCAMSSRATGWRSAGATPSLRNGAHRGGGTSRRHKNTIQVFIHSP